MAVDLTKPPRPPSDLADKFMLRLPDGMRDRLKAAAESSNRSMNAEIVSRLEYSLHHFESSVPMDLDVADKLTTYANALIDAINNNKKNGGRTTITVQHFDADGRPTAAPDAPEIEAHVGK